MNAARFALRHARLFAFVAVVLGLLGVRSYLVAPQSIFPPMSFSRIDVVVDAGDLPPDRVRIAVTRPLEQALSTLPSLQRVRATSAQGSSELLLDFDPRTNPQTDQQLTQADLEAARSNLPEAKSLSAVIVNPNAEPVLSYAFRSDVLSQAALEQYLELRVLPGFAGTPGLARAGLVGGPPVEYRVDLEPSALASLGLSAADVASAIGEATDVRSVGTAERYHEQYALLVDAGVHDARTLAAIAIPTSNGNAVPLRSIADVRLGVGIATHQAGENGRAAVILSAYPLAGADAVALARAFESRLAQVAPTLPAGVRVTKYWDQTRLIVDSQSSLRDAILLGALLAVAVIFAFLRDLRMTLVAAAVIPLAMAIAVFVLERSGQTLNLMSVGGLAVAVGLIIDDAIVVIEGIARAREEQPHLAAADATAVAVGRLGLPMAASTATTLVVFVPLGLLTGVTGFFFRALAFTLSAALIVSLLLALFVTPLLAASFLAARTAGAHRADGLTARYRPILRWALQHRAAVFAGAGLVLVATVVLMSRLPSDFLPSLDEGEFEIAYTLPPGATLATTVAAAATMERIVRADPAVASEGRLTGIDTDGYSPTLPNAGTIRVSLVAGARPSYDVVSSRIRDAIGAAVPAANLDIHQLLEDQINDLAGAPQPIEIAIAGPDQQQLIALASATADAISHVRGLVDPFDGVVFDDPSVRFVPQPANLAALGVGVADLRAALASRTQGTTAAYVPSDDGRTVVPVQVRVAGATPQAGAFGTTTVFAKGKALPVNALANVDSTGLESEIDDENGRQLVRVTANIEGAPLSAVIAGIRRALDTVPHPPGYTFTIGGAYETQQASFGEFLSVIAIAVGLVFTVMLGVFGSFRMPLVILGAIPLALIGVALGLALTATPINVSSFMGLLLLVGLVVKNGILLLDVAERRRLAGDDVEEALLVAGSTRVRPIVMTTLAAIGGLFPLALGIGSGAEMERPLAIAVIGGLSTATAFTLIVIPVLYRTMLGRAPVRRLVVGATTGLVLVACALHARPASAQELVPERFAISLEAAEAAALTSSPDVRVARADLAGAEAALAIARGQSGIAGIAGYSEAPQGAPGATIAQRVTNVGAQVTLGDLLGRSPAIAQADANRRAALSDVATAERGERLKVVMLYFGALQARELLSARNAGTSDAERFLQAAQQRYGAGTAPRLDVLRAQVAYARAVADAATARAADANAAEALAIETGLAAPQFVPAPDAALGAGALAGAAVVAPEAAVARALAQRADLRSADEDVRASRAAVEAARRAQLPPVTLSGGYETGSDSGYAISGPTLSVQVAVPLGGGQAAKVRAAQALLDAAQARRDGVVRAIRTEVAAAARNAAASIEAETAAAQALEAARAELTATTIGYGAGASSSLDVSTARTAFEQALVDALTARFERLQAVASLSLEMAP